MSSREECKRLNCKKLRQLDGLCATHFRAKHGITTGEARRRRAGEPIESGRSYEMTAVAPDGRGYNLKTVGSLHILRNFNVDNETAATLLNASVGTIVQRRKGIAKSVIGVDVDNEVIINKIAKALQR